MRTHSKTHEIMFNKALRYTRSFVPLGKQIRLHHAWSFKKIDGMFNGTSQEVTQLQDYQIFHIDKKQDSSCAIEYHHCFFNTFLINIFQVTNFSKNDGQRSYFYSILLKIIKRKRKRLLIFFKKRLRGSFLSLEKSSKTTNIINNYHKGILLMHFQSLFVFEHQIVSNSPLFSLSLKTNINFTSLNMKKWTIFYLTLIRPQPIQLMIRKISQKALFQQEKAHRVQTKVEDNQYYLPQPNSKYNRPAKEDDRQKPSLKISRKASQNGSLRTYSIALFKPQPPSNDSKELTTSTSGHGRLKVQSRKIRSSSHSEALQVLHSKSAMKLQLNRKDHPVRRINLKLETPNKKQRDQKEPDYDSYYNNGGPITAQSKTVRAQNKVDPTHLSGRISKGSEFSILYTRCCKLIEDYQQQLQEAKRENGLLLQQNRRLRGERGA